MSGWTVFNVSICPVQFFGNREIRGATKKIPTVKWGLMNRNLKHKGSLLLALNFATDQSRHTEQSRP